MNLFLHIYSDITIDITDHSYDVATGLTVEMFKVTIRLLHRNVSDLYLYRYDEIYLVEILNRDKTDRNFCVGKYEYVSKRDEKKPKNVRKNKSCHY